MSFFVDANVIVYAATASEYKRPCGEIVAAVSRRDAAGVTSTAVVEEVWHVELRERTELLPGTAAGAYRLFTPLLDVTDEAIRLALDLDAPRLGANDRVHVGTCLAHGIDTIVSADAGFDGVPGIRRIDPLDEPALAGILRR